MTGTPLTHDDKPSTPLSPVIGTMHTPARSTAAVRLWIGPLLDERHLGIANVRDSVRGPSGDIDRVASFQVMTYVVKSHLSVAGKDEPVLGTMGVTLVAEPATGINLDPLDLVRLRVVQHGERAPGSLLVRRCHGLSLAAGPAGCADRPARSSRSGRCWRASASCRLRGRDPWERFRAWGGAYETGTDGEVRRHARDRERRRKGRDEASSRRDQMMTGCKSVSSP